MLKLCPCASCGVIGICFHHTPCESHFFFLGVHTEKLNILPYINILFHAPQLTYFLKKKRKNQTSNQEILGLPLRPTERS